MNVQQFDFSVNLLEAILWQYDNAENIQSLLTQKQSWYNNNQTNFWTDWFINVFNLETANAFGLQVWSIILNIPLFIGPNPDDLDKPVWGFGVFNQNFNNGNFGVTSEVDGLTLEEKRLLLRLRFFQLVSRTAIPEVNKFYKYVFKNEGSVYLLDGLHMDIYAVFDYPINPKLVALIKKYDVIPRGAGVELNYIIDPRSVWGFGVFNQNFNNGTFIQEV